MNPTLVVGTPAAVKPWGVRSRSVFRSVRWLVESLCLPVPPGALGGQALRGFGASNTPAARAVPEA